MIQDNYNNTIDIITKMLYAMIHQIIGLGWLLVPYPVYLLYNKHYLDQKQAQLLIIQTIILFSLMLPGWLMHFIRLIFTGFFVLVVLDLAIIQYEEFVARYEIGDKKRKTKHYKLINGKPIFMVEHHKMLKKLKLQETFILQILIMLWVLLKMHFTKAQYFGINRTLPDSTVFKGFVQTYNGWNCNYPQFTYIPLIYFIILLFSYWFMGKVLANARADEQINSQSYNDVNGYKIYLCKYLMTPALLFITIDFLFNLFAHLSCSGLLECYQFYKNGVLAFLVMCWGVPAAIGLFFYKKVGRFSLQSEHDQSQGSIDLAQLNQQHKQRRLNRSK